MRVRSYPRLIVVALATLLLPACSDYKDDGSHRHTEHTLYAGRHYLEVYVVKNTLVVATDHHEVPIR